MPKGVKVCKCIGLAALMAAPLAACSPGLGFLGQAGWGQLDLLSRAEPIERVPAPPKLRALLDEIPRIKRFAAERGLSISDNYRSYAELDRDAAIYVVTASAPLAFDKEVWSFPLVGSFPYLGWFDEGEAEGFAAGLAADGLDVWVRPASAYSTLGWFEDPVLSSMIVGSAHPLGDLTNTVIHEATHATVHIDSQSYLNESLAAFVGDTMTVEYLRANHPDTLERFAALALARQSDRRALLDAYEELKAVYSSQATEADKRSTKEQILSRLDAHLHWDRPINNATLIAVMTYRAGIAAMERLFARCDQDWRRFLAGIEEIGRAGLPREQLEDLSEAVGAAPCPGE